MVRNPDPLIHRSCPLLNAVGYLWHPMMSTLVIRHSMIQQDRVRGTHPVELIALNRFFFLQSYGELRGFERLIKLLRPSQPQYYGVPEVPQATNATIGIDLVD